MQVGDIVALMKERNNLYDKNAVAVFNSYHEKIGYVSTKSLYNIKVQDYMQHCEIKGSVWGIFKTFFLVELVMPKNPPPKNKFDKIGIEFK